MSANADAIVVGAPTVERVDTRSRWSVPVDGPVGTPNSIWYEVPAEFECWFTDRADPALVALTIPAMRMGVPLSIEGVVTDELAFWHRDYQAVYSASGERPPIDVHTRKLAPAAKGGNCVAAGFSGGIDSFALLGEHFYSPDTPRNLRPSHLLFNNVGSHAEGGQHLWRRRFERLQPTVDRIGLPFLDIDSNLDQIPSPGIGYEQLNSPANASVAHVLARGLDHWIFASSAEFRRVGVVRSAYNTAFVDSIAMPLACTSELTLSTASSRLRRIDKTRIVAEIPDAWTALDVCIEVRETGQTNCSRCWKCQLTLAALDLLGAADRFGSQFDLELWFDVRREYLARLEFVHSPALIAELNELIDEVGYVVDVAARRDASRDHAKARLRAQFQRLRRRIGTSFPRPSRR